MQRVPVGTLVFPAWCITNSSRFQIEEVKGVEQVMDQEEEISMHEFAKFEEKLRQQKGAAATASSSIDNAP